MSVSYFKIQGKNALSGTITPQGNKNEALPLLGAVCMVRGKSIIENMPDIKDVTMLMDVLQSLGFEIKELAKGKFEFINPENISSDLPVELCNKIRGAVTLAGPILARNDLIV